MNVDTVQTCIVDIYSDPTPWVISFAKVSSKDVAVPSTNRILQSLIFDELLERRGKQRRQL